MKKYVYSLVLLLGLVGLYKADKAGAIELRSAVGTTGNDLATSDYSGFNYSTGAFTIGIVTATLQPSNPAISTFTAQGVFSEVCFSTGIPSSNDFVEVYDSTDASVATKFTIGRFYNVGNSSITYSQTGCYGPRRPVRFRNGLRWFSSSSQYNMISVMFQQY